VSLTVTQHDPLCTHSNSTYKYVCICPVLEHVRLLEQAKAEG